MNSASAITSEDDVSEAKRGLESLLKFNREITDEGEQLFDELVRRAPPIASNGDNAWWLGRCQLLSSHLLTQALRDAGKWRLLDGSPVFVTTMPGEDGGQLEIETDLLVLGCDTGLRFTGRVRHHSSADGAELLSVVVDDSEFFEPSDEFGITKALKKCEAELRPKLPSDAHKLHATLRAVFADESMILLMEEDAPEDREPHRIVLARCPPP